MIWFIDSLSHRKLGKIYVSIEKVTLLILTLAMRKKSCPFWSADSKWILTSWIDSWVIYLSRTPICSCIVCKGTKREREQRRKRKHETLCRAIVTSNRFPENIFLNFELEFWKVRQLDFDGRRSLWREHFDIVWWGHLINAISVSRYLYTHGQAYRQICTRCNNGACGRWNQRKRREKMTAPRHAKRPSINLGWTAVSIRLFWWSLFAFSFLFPISFFLFFFSFFTSPSFGFVWFSVWFSFANRYH